jgi:hypothetical protein
MIACRAAAPFLPGRQRNHQRDIFIASAEQLRLPSRPNSVRDANQLRYVADVDHFLFPRHNAYLHPAQLYERTFCQASRYDLRRLLLSWMQVSAGGSGSSVTIHLHLSHKGDEAEINQVLDQTVSNIQGMFS